MSSSELKRCRICGNDNLVPILDLGEQALTGVFPETRDTPLTKGPLRLVKCMSRSGSGETCGLVQLDRSYSLSEMYGENYGYRSGLNASMVKHLHAKVARILERVPLTRGDLVVDIGSNDGTTLGAYPDVGADLVGVDPTGEKFRNYYADHVQLIPDFFSPELVEARFDGRKAKVVTSFSMFYDLESPLDFMRGVKRILAQDGIWVFEQSYLPAMLETNSYDTACHEHLEYYALRQIKWMTDRAGLSIVEVAFNDVNGGSFSVSVSHAGNGDPAPELDDLLAREARAGLDGTTPFEAFADRVAGSKRDLLDLLRGYRAKGLRVHGLGASTKGNVLLQYCGLTAEDLHSIGEVNGEKVGRFTPGSLIPIVAEAELLASDPDLLVVLPWHFREFFLQSGKLRGRRLLFPLPKVEVVEVG